MLRDVSGDLSGVTASVQATEQPSIEPEPLPPELERLLFHEFGVPGMSEGGSPFSFGRRSPLDGGHQ